MTDPFKSEIEIMLKEAELRDLITHHSKEALQRTADNPEAHERQRVRLQELINHYSSIVQSLTEIQQADLELFGE